MIDNIPELKIELMDDSEGSLILLEQDCCGNMDRVAIHPIHLRFMAEKFGLVETSDPQAAKTIAMLVRRLNVLRGRIDCLGEYMTNVSDHAHANLDYELGYLTATAEIAEEFCMDLPDITVRTACSHTSGDGHAPSPQSCKDTDTGLKAEVGQRPLI